MNPIQLNCSLEKENNITSSCSKHKGASSATRQPVFQKLSTTELRNSPLQHLAIRVEKAVSSYLHFLFSSSLQKDLKALSPQDLGSLLDILALELDLQKLEQFISLLPSEAVENAVRERYPEYKEAFQSVKEMAEVAKYFFETANPTTPSPFSVKLSALLDSLVYALEAILGAFGIQELFSVSETPWEAEFKGNKIMMLLSLFMMISGLIAPTILPIVGGVFLGICLLSLIYPYIKPRTSRLPRAVNWTKQHQEGNLLVTDGRKAIRDEMARTLIASRQTKTHVLLIGKTGVGKTETAKSFVEAVERGDYPELKGKQIHYINTADLLQGSDFSHANKILSRLSETISRHRENFILVLDEIHMACHKNSDHPPLSEQLKTYLDPGTHSFPYVIGITTEEEYYREIYKDNAAFARRFKPIAIENTNEEETQKILNNALIKQAPYVLLDEEIIPTIFQKTVEAFGSQAAQPATSLKVLSQCIKKVAESEKSPLQKRIEKLQSAIFAIYAKKAAAQGSGLVSYRQDGVTELEKELEKKQTEALQEKIDLEKLHQKIKKLASFKQELFKSALKVNAANPLRLSSKGKTTLATFLAQSHFFLPSLEEDIRQEASRLGVKVSIDSQLVDRVIEEEIENGAKVEAATQKGKIQIALRA